MVISSSQNSQIKLARSLGRKRRREAAGLCLLEGARLVADAWRAGSRPASVFFVPEWVETSQPAQALLAEMEATGTETTACTPEVFAAFSDTVTPQGIAAIVPIPAPPSPTPSDWILLLDQLRDPGNAGTLLRSAAAAGVGLTIFGPGTVDAYNGKVLRAAMGAHFRLPPQTCNHWHELESILPPGRPVYLAEAGASQPYDQVDWTQPAVLVVGGEAAGASPEIRALATPIAIPMQRHTESLNAAIAGSVILFEAARQRRRA